MSGWSVAVEAQACRTTSAASKSWPFTLAAHDQAVMKEAGRSAPLRMLLSSLCRRRRERVKRQGPSSRGCVSERRAVRCITAASPARKLPFALLGRGSDFDNAPARRGTRGPTRCPFGHEADVRAGAGPVEMSFPIQRPARLFAFVEVHRMDRAVTSRRGASREPPGAPCLSARAHGDRRRPLVRRSPGAGAAGGASISPQGDYKNVPTSRAPGGGPRGAAITRNTCTATARRPHDVRSEIAEFLTATAHRLPVTDVRFLPTR